MSKIKVCIDPGHGGSSRSNVGKNGYVEADGVLTLSLALRDALFSTGMIDVIMTRDKDMTVELYARGIQAKGCDLFISEHTDAGGGSGTTVLYSVDLPQDKNLAASISKAISSQFGKPDRGAKTKYATIANKVDDGLNGEDYYAVIDQAQDIGCKHVLLVESMFHDNLSEEAILLKKENLIKIAQLQAKCICDWFGIAYPSEAEWKRAIRATHDKADEWIDVYQDLIDRGGIYQFIPNSLLKLYKK